MPYEKENIMTTQASPNNGVFSKYFLCLAFIYFLSIVTTTVSADYFFRIHDFDFAGGIFIFPFSFLVGAVIGEVYNYSYQRLFIVPAFMLVKTLKRKEQVDFFDVGTKFKPFSLCVDNVYKGTT